MAEFVDTPQGNPAWRSRRKTTDIRGQADCITRDVKLDEEAKKGGRGIEMQVCMRTQLGIGPQKLLL